MSLRLATVSPRDLVEFRKRVRRVKYADIYQALEAGNPIRIDAETPEELGRCFRAINRWVRRQGLSVQRVCSGTTLMVAPQWAGNGPQSPAEAPDGLPAPSEHAPLLPAAAKRGKGPADESWERLMRPPDPPSYEKLMGIEKKSP